MGETRNQEIKAELSDRQLGCGISSEEVRVELAKILASRTFRSARGQRKFLDYAVTESVAGRALLIKEYLIGREALGRGETFDPRLDPIVRTQARKLRLRLAKYYQTEGANDPIRIEFRRGSYAPLFQRMESESVPITAEPFESAATPAGTPGERVALTRSPVSIPPVPSIRRGSALVRNRLALAIPVCALAIAIAVAVYRWLSN
jgi:hypothetical protein